ncbi:hypothetical protein ACFPYN_11890 [Paenisporosarcina macmurdoensis]|uniref:Transposase n=1 Tax=Paenisporosarcina macmurdoensis TaxID=212659 RepID=A0ABW1LA73_9BACL
MEKQYDEDLIKLIPVPKILDERHVELAIKFARGKQMEGFTIADFCKHNGISTKTWYGFLETPEFKHYLGEVQNAVIPNSEKDAYQQFKNHVLRIPYKQNPSIKELEFFGDTFSYLVENEKRQKLKALDSENTSSAKFTNEEARRSNLMARLKG